MPTINSESAGPIQMTAEVGRTGLRQYAGYIFEEFDNDLRGQRGMRLYHEMRRNDPTVAVGLRLIKWMIGRVPWTVQPGGTTPADEEAAAFLESCMHDLSGTWSKFLRDSLTCLDFGFSYIEQVFKVRNGPKGKTQSRYDDGRIGWRKMIPISQETLLRWDIDEADEGIRGMVQLPSLTGSYIGGEINIPIEKSILFRLDDDRNNPEGVSLLRSAYRPYHLKKNIEEIEAIGIERDLTGVLIIYMPVNATVTDKEKAIQLLEQYKSDDMSGFVAPQMGPGEHERWRFEIINSPGNKTIDPDKVIQRYQMEIARSFLAQFLMLGQGTTGSFALSKDQTDVFELAIGAILSNLEETINRYPVPLLFRLNDFGTLTALPQIKPGKISRGDVERFSMALKNLTDSGLLTPDRQLEAHIRQEMELPELLEEEEEKPSEETGEGEGDEKEAFSEARAFHLGGQHDQKSHGAKSLGSDAEAKTFLNDQYGDWKKGLSDKEMAGMAFYQSPGYELMNGSLRGMSVNAPPKDLKRAKDAVTGMDSAIAKAPPLSGGGLTVYRGFSADQFKLEAGAVVTDNGFVSTSLTKGQAGSYTSRGRQAFAKIYLPDGTKAAAGSVKELVLPRGSSFRVVSVKGSGKTVQVEMELVP